MKYESIKQNCQALWGTSKSSPYHKCTRPIYNVPSGGTGQANHIKSCSCILRYDIPSKQLSSPYATPPQCIKSSPRSRPIHKTPSGGPWFSNHVPLHQWNKNVKLIRGTSTVHQMQPMATHAHGVVCVTVSLLLLCKTWSFRSFSFSLFLAWRTTVVIQLSCKNPWLPSPTHTWKHQAP